MTRIHVSIEQRCSSSGDPMIVDALDVPTALAIADINMRDVSAELWAGERRLGRLIKHGGDYASFWELGPN
ncbi:MAG: hypothetical protein HKO08_05965 [Erythrobacter sp.]|nr:hypothetical protein [Erythrobacter sp.]